MDPGFDGLQTTANVCMHQRPDEETVLGRLLGNHATLLYGVGYETCVLARTEDSGVRI